jgi:hypothetical protein
MKTSQQGLTKKCFEHLLKKAAQPVSEWKHGQEGKGTSVARPSGGCSGKHKSQGKTEDKEG